MRVPLSWLADYVTLDLAPDALAERMTLRGMEVSSIEVAGADWSDVVAGRLLSVERHPNADKLWLTSVDVGADAPLEIVCGADNIAPGQLVPVALVGARLPGDRVIQRTKIRGVVSNGMLCSAIELGIGEDADGIHLLGTADELPVGTDLRPLFGDVILDVDVKPNRGDALSMVGLAREIAAFTGATLRLPDATLTEDPALTAASLASVEIRDPAACPRFTARWLQDVVNGPSPSWIQRRLLAAGMRPVSAVVDVTNYVMHELGQPMHAYDADTVPDGRIVVRRATKGERLVTIDHVERTLDERMLVIADGEHAIGLAGIMGGAETEVRDSTVRIILESAIFHGPTIRNSARRLGLRSEASMRHEKGIGQDLPRYALDRAAHLIAEIGGARVATGIVDNDPTPPGERVIQVDLARLSGLIGLELSADEVERQLAPLGFGTVGADTSSVSVSVPSFRLDVTAPEDVAEEVTRAYGYDRVPSRLPEPALPPFRPDPSADRHLVRRILAGMGLDEIISHALIGPDDLRRSGYAGDGDALVRVANPLAEQHAILRPVLVPSLLAALRENVRQRRLDPWLFEVGKTYWMGEERPSSAGDSAGTGRYEAWYLGLALLGPRTSRTPDSAAPDADLGELKGVIDALHRALGARPPGYRAELEDERLPHLHPARAASIVDAAGNEYGSVGEVDPRVAAAWDLPGRPVLAAIDLAQLLALVPEQRRAAPVPSAQPIDRDLAIVVGDDTPVGDLLRLLRAAAGPMLADARLFDVYRGPQVGEGRVSYAVSLRFQPEHAADDAAVDRALGRVRGSLAHHLGADFR